MICPCCTRRVDRSPLPINCSTNELAYLGSGYPLYFDFIKFCGIILLILFASSGAFNLYTNLMMGKDCRTESEITDGLTTDSEK